MKTALAPHPAVRSLALDILVQARRRERSVEDLLAATLSSYPHMARPDRGLLLELVQGVKRWQVQLDYDLAGLAARPLKKLHPLVLEILRLGIFQLTKLERVPARAVLHEAGKLAQERRLDPAQAGFINAVLRRLAAGETPPWPDAAQDPALALSIAQAHPLWLAQRWLNRWGPEETTARLAANNAIPPLTIRVNTLKTDAARLADRLAQEGLEARPARFSPDGLILAHPEVSPAALPSYREGLWLFQDEAAQLAAMLAPLEPGQTVVELGAGRGGKTSHLAEMLKRQGKVLALDTHWGRLGDLARLMRRWGAAGVQPVRADAARALPLKPRWAHLAVVDAPCSALGIIRRHPEIKTRLTLADLASFPPRQRAMLTAAAGVVRPGGHILYITCTTEPEENEQVVADFLAARPDFALANAAAALPAAARGLVDPAGFFRTDPARHNLDGFFAALLAKIN